MYYLIHFAFPLFFGTKESCDEFKKEILKKMPKEEKRLMIISKSEYEELWQEEVTI